MEIKKVSEPLNIEDRPAEVHYKKDSKKYSEKSFENIFRNVEPPKNVVKIMRDGYEVHKFEDD